MGVEMLRFTARASVLSVVLFLILVCFGGCGPKVREQAARDLKKEAQAQPTQRATERPQQQEAEPTAAAQSETTAGESMNFEDIHFEFDRSNLNMTARQVLNRIAFIMFDHPELSILIEGHCDERGSNEYNLALGERRAEAAKDYLIDMGIEPHRIRTISYGEERPLALGHNEAAWAVNRRAHFAIIDK
ncbi:MAG: peptidoglycan-associated lipoprotein Pal [Candidatus Coatesbacteria bacterium]|nr:MAG: peptidoglycan-associated lipoprotein Pal [Candidatus Coatesbacteria bacterium]